MKKKTLYIFLALGFGVLLPWLWKSAAVPELAPFVEVVPPVAMRTDGVSPTISQAEWPAIYEQIAAEQRAFRAAPDGALHSYNPTGGERLILQSDGSATMRLRGEESGPAPATARDHLGGKAVVAAEDDRPSVTLRLKAKTLGRGESTKSLTSNSEVKVVAKHATERHLATPEGAVVEWWKSDARGFEVGWTIAQRPSGEGPLRLALALECSWPAETSADGDRLIFQDPAGTGWRMVCDGLIAYDAKGRTLPARMLAENGHLTISVEDAGASYPIVIDPWLYGDRALVIKANDSATGSRFGARLAACGDILVVAGKDPNGNDGFDGEAYIMSRSGSNYAVRRKIFNVAIPDTFAFYAAPGFAVSGDTVAVGPVLGQAAASVNLYERNAGGISAFGIVAEIPVDPTRLITPRLDGDFLVVPSFGATANGFLQAGVVNVHGRDTGGPGAWGVAATLNAGDLTMTDGGFGVGMELRGDTLVVVARAPVSGMACFIFQKTSPDGSQWTRRKVIILPGVPVDPLSVRLLGDTLVVGAPTIGSVGVRIFDRNAGGPENWGLVRTLAAPAGTDSFGFSMALLGGLLAVDTPDEDVDHDNNAGTPKISNAGVVRLYAKDAGGLNNWGLLETISEGASAEVDGRFGEGLAFGDGRLLIGRPKGDAGLPTVVDSGAVNGFTMSSGDWRASGLSAHSQNATSWGSAVAVSGPYVLVGAPRFDGPAGVDAGWAFLFRDGVLVKSLLPSGQQAGERFGESVAMDGDRLVVGSPRRSGVLNGQSYADLGGVTIFERNQGGLNNWGVVKSFSQAFIGVSGSPEFGTSVALQGDVLAVGAPRESALSMPGTAVLGRTKIFYRNTGGMNNWGQVRTFRGEDNGTEELFGTSMSLSGDTLVVGAPWEQVGGNIRSGAAYIHRRNHGGADNWGLVARLIQPMVKGDSWFGASVALDGDSVVIGTPHEDRGLEPNVGAVYFFEGGRTLQDEWSFTCRWQAEDWGIEAEGGNSVSLSNGLALIGIPSSDGTTGKAELRARHAGGSDQWGVVWEDSGQESFGTAVAIDGLHFAIGEPLADVTVSGVSQTDRGRTFSYLMQGAEFAAVAARTGGAGAARMGSSVALHADWLVVGAPGEDINNSIDAGAAYVFHRDRPAAGAWGLMQKLTDEPAAANMRFGAAVAVDAQWLMVGVPGGHRVKAFFREEQITPEALPWVNSISLSAGDPSNALGTCLAMEDGLLIAGAPMQDVGGNMDSGAAYVFERNTSAIDSWGLLATLTPTDPAAGDAFGTSVALSESRAALGSPLDNNGEGVDAGSVYLFERNQGGANGWGQFLKITNNLQVAGDEMGRSVALRNGYLLTGLPRAETAAGTDAGRALLLGRNQGGANFWGLVKTFSASDGTAQSRFGTAVAINSDHAVIGAPFADPRGLVNTGTAYIYSRNWTGSDAWGELQILAPTNLSGGAEFGSALALDHHTVAFGAPADFISGRAHVHGFRAREFYDEWATAHGLDGAWALPDADADGDGQSNLIELVLGSHPLNGSQLGRITMDLTGGNFTLTAHKKQACSVPLTFGAEISHNLIAWIPASPGQILTDSPSQLRLQLPITPLPRQFVRWRAELP